MEYKIIFLEKGLDEVIDQRLRAKLTDTWNDEWITWPVWKSLGTTCSLSIYLCFMHKDFWMGVLNHLLKDDVIWKRFLCSRWGCEIFSNGAKLSSAPVPRIKNDRSLKQLTLSYWDEIIYQSMILLLFAVWKTRRQRILDALLSNIKV